MKIYLTWNSTQLEDTLQEAQGLKKDNKLKMYQEEFIINIKGHKKYNALLWIKNVAENYHPKG